MTYQTFLKKLSEQPETVEFEESMTVIDAHYDFTPTPFQNGNTVNEAGQNNGSCKILAFAKQHNLTTEQTLNCFGHFYRHDVLTNPNGTDHQNIRNIMDTGLEGVQFEDEPLSLKTQG